MNLLDRLKQAEAAATPGPWELIPGEFDYAYIFADHKQVCCAGTVPDPNADLTVLLRNHAADLIRLMEAAREYMAGAGNDSATWIDSPFANLKRALRPFLAEEDAR